MAANPAKPLPAREVPPRAAVSFYPEPFKSRVAGRQGRPSLYTNEGKTELAPGMCMGFKAGTGDAHHLRNETAEEVFYLEIGDRMPGDEVDYPDDDLRVVDRKYLHKDGTPY